MFKKNLTLYGITQWSKAGHQIHLGVRDINSFRGKELLNNENTSIHSIKEAIEPSEVVVVATPPQIAHELIKNFGDISGRIVIDTTNAIRSHPKPYPTAFHAFEDLTDAEVVKCFNTTGFENMTNPIYGQIRLDMFMAGNSTKAKSIATQLAKDAGFEHCYDFGNSDTVELLEKFALSWINLAIFQGMGRNIGFKLIKR